MADTKGSALPAMTTPAGTDILIAVDDPGGAPATQKVTFADAWTNYFKIQADGLYLTSVATGDIADDAVTFPKLLNATQTALVGAEGAGGFGEITLGSGLDITTGALDVVTNAAASSWTANTKSSPATDDYLAMFDPDNASDDLKEYGLTVANLNTYLATQFEAIDADILRADTGDTLTAGYLSDSYSGGTVTSGTYTPAPATGQENFQHITNGGAFTLAPPASPCTVVLQITNNGSAGTITTSGFTVVDGDSFTLNNGDDFMCFITKTNDFSYLSVKAMQ